MDLDLAGPAGKLSRDKLEGDVSAALWSLVMRRSRNDKLLFAADDSRLSGRFEVACEPNGGIGTESKLVDHPVPLAIDVPEMDWVVSSGSISMWALHVWASEVKVESCEGFHWDSGMVCVPVKKRWGGEEECSSVSRNTLNVLADMHRSRHENLRGSVQAVGKIGYLSARTCRLALGWETNSQYPHSARFPCGFYYRKTGTLEQPLWRHEPHLLTPSTPFVRFPRAASRSRYPITLPCQRG